jgi:GNAT superfamily N-acetyltransferase
VEAVRPATAEDAPRLRELAGDLVAGVLAQRDGPLLFGPADAEGDGEALVGGIAGGAADGPGAGRLMLVGTFDGVVTGFACGHVDRGRRGTRARGVLDACYVELGARGVGIGRLLVESMISWFEDQGVDGVDGTALPGDREAKNFFESAGFKARMLTMYRPNG